MRQHIGNYRILGPLGQGGMGVVYQGVDAMLERPVAIKMLRAEIARRPDLIARFRVEAATLARLNHRSIATLYNFFESAGEHYMVMEFVRGRTVEALLRASGRLAPEAAVEIARQTLDAMAHAHSLGVLHRDIKPANIMVTNEGAVKVTDFGIARVLGASRLTREGRILGTLEYIAPERIRGEEADIRADLYSLGVLLYEMLAGRLPFVSDTDFGLIQAHLVQPPPALPALGLHHSPELEAIIRKALAKRPADRFQTAEEFRDALTRYLERRAAPPPVPRARRRPVPVGAVAAVTAVSLLGFWGAGAWAIHRAQAQPPRVTAEPRVAAVWAPAPQPPAKLITTPPPQPEPEPEPQPRVTTPARKARATEKGAIAALVPAPTTPDPITPHPITPHQGPPEVLTSADPQQPAPASPPVESAPRPGAGKSRRMADRLTSPLKKLLR